MLHSLRLLDHLHRMRRCLLLLPKQELEMGKQVVVAHLQEVLKVLVEVGVVSQLRLPLLHLDLPEEQEVLHWRGLTPLNKFLGLKPMGAKVS